ncbi:hypothetical protein BH766_gp35 [Gordonia phage Demosthenes]|uniref:Uncharacterized protein n=1 Tax=Gordonia phage Demosthenes TaxID=1838067 RepID=A0A160DE07_9CAUD|nr:hypothetical protein BH766_gp35 [Gordonia phage Demosthenes]ANA86005.1 hypothetical protein PBI_DEMOSTHENES_35 [Gordonia phage Demosthenes]
MRSRLQHKLHADDITNRDTVQDLTGLFGILATASGLSLVIQGEAIWALGVYDTAKTLPQSPESWGLIAILAGILMFIGMYWGKHKVMKAGACIAGLWNFFFALSFCDEAYKGNIAWQPVILYFITALVYAVLFYTYKGSNAVQRAETRQS